MRTRRRIRVVTAIAAREAKRFAALVAMRAGREAASSLKRRPGFRPLTEAEAEAILGGELLAALSGVRRHAYVVLSRIA